MYTVKSGNFGIGINFDNCTSIHIIPPYYLTLLFDLAKNVKNKNTLKFYNCINNAAKNFIIIFQMWSLNNFDVWKLFIILENFGNLIFQTFSKLFIQSIFYLQISRISKKDSSGNEEFLDNIKWHKYGMVLQLFTVLSGWVDFCPNYPPWTISTSRGIFN